MIGMIIGWRLGLFTGILISFYTIVRLIQVRPWVALDWFKMSADSDIPRRIYRIRRKY